MGSSINAAEFFRLDAYMITVCAAIPGSELQNLANTITRPIDAHHQIYKFGMDLSFSVSQGSPNTLTINHPGRTGHTTQEDVIVVVN